MKIAVIGAGGVGGYFGGRLAQAGNDVTFVDAGPHLLAMQQNGLKVKSVHGDFHINPAQATDNLATIGKVDLVIISLKTHQIKNIAKQLHHIVGDETIVVPFGNGVMAVEELKEHIAPYNLIGGLCKIMSRIETPGVINHSGAHKGDTTIIFGELDNAKTPRIAELKTLFDNAGIVNIIADDIIAEIWRKFIGICISGLLGVTRTNFGELRELPETRAMMVDLLAEIYAVSKKVGVNLENDIVEKNMAAFEHFPADSTSSLAIDVIEGRPSEIEYQNGSVVHLAKRYDIDVPVNRFVYSCILPMDLKAKRAQAAK